MSLLSPFIQECLLETGTVKGISFILVIYSLSLPPQKKKKFKTNFILEFSGSMAILNLRNLGV